MKLDLKQPELSIRNEYTLQLFDEDNNLLQEVKCHNAASSRKFITACMNDGYWNRNFYLVLGSGTGVINIDENNHYLFNHKFGASMEYQMYRVNPVLNSFDEEVHCQAKISFPATTSYVGDLTEIGIAYYREYESLLSHSLLVDAEGNPIIVKKTSTNILIVTVDWFFSVKLSEQPYNFKYFPPWASILTGVEYPEYTFFSYQKHYFAIGSYDYGDGAAAPFTLIDKIEFSASFCGTETENNNNVMKYPIMSSTEDYYNFRLEYPKQSSFPLVASKANLRWDSGQGNIGFIHSIVFPGIGVIPLPNHDICPPYEYNNIVVGTGDGVTSTFLPYINEIVSAIGYVNGESITTTFQNFDPRRSSLWNKCIKVVSNTTQYDVPGHSGWFRTMYKDDTKFSSYNLRFCTALLSEYTHGGSGYPAFIESYQSDYIYYDENSIILDHARVGRYRMSSGDYFYTPTVTIFYSNDGEQWTSLVSFAEAYKTVYFDRISAKYWKIHFQSPSTTTSSRYVATFSSAEQEVQNTEIERNLDPKFFVAGDSQEFDFGKCGITFETPPPEGSTITMDAILDLPYKDKDIVMTISIEAEQSDPNEVTV